MAGPRPSGRTPSFVSERWFGPMHQATFHHEQILDPEGLVERFRSVSHVAVLPPDEQAAVLDEVRARYSATIPTPRGTTSSHSPTGSTRTGASDDEAFGAKSDRDRCGTSGRLALTRHRPGQGATISGRVMNAVAPDLLRELAADQQVVLVSATNGKTTTTALLAAALGTDGRPLVTNSTGANLTSGIAPTLARAHPGGTAVLEVDERVRGPRRRAVAPRAPSCSATSAVTSSTASARSTRSAAPGVPWPRHTRSWRSSPTHRTPTWCGRPARRRSPG